MVRETKLYDTLGVASSASVDELRRAYKKLALKYHPDKNQDPGAEAKFKDISHAFDILGDEAKRRKYDQFGEKGVSGDDGGGGGMDASDIFASMFGGGPRRRGEPKPKPIVHQLPVSLEHFYKGRVAKLAITRNRFCTVCDGSGSNKPGVSAKCVQCNGRGVRMAIRQLAPGMVTQMQVTCPDCSGKGSSLKPEDRCEGCDGKQVLPVKKIFEVNVDKGSKTGDDVTFSGEGDQVAGINLSGDIIIVFDQKHHDRFTRAGNHLLMERTISLADALTGFHSVIEHLDGRNLCIESTPGEVLDPSFTYCISREGMPVTGSGGVERGDLFIQFRVNFPTAVGSSDLAQLRHILGGGAQSPVPKDAEECILRRTQVDLEKLKRDAAADAGGDDLPRRGGRQQASCQQQ